MRSRNWCFTINNWTEEDFMDMSDIENNKATYVILGFETGEKGTDHIQGYMEFKNPVRLETLRKINGRAHYEARKGTQKQASDYCMKDGDYIEFGEKGSQGKRSDLEDIKELAMEGADYYTLASAATSWQAINGITKLRYMLVKPRDHHEKPHVKWFYGKSGAGKSLTAKKECNFDYDDCHFENGFLIGYNGNKNVIFDDFRGSIPLNILLKMIDYGKCTVNTKGGSTYFGAVNIYFTSSKHPQDVYHVPDENIRQLLRRIDMIKDFGTEVPGTEVGGNTNPDPLD